MKEILYIASAGGAGTTFLIEWLAQFTDTNDPYDRDRLKHTRRPLSNSRLAEWKVDGNPTPVNVRKSLYIFGNPEEACISHFRRGWASLHAKRTTGKKPEVENLDQLIEKKQDIFEFENHFDNWLKGSDYPIMFVRYEAMWENLDKIFEYAEVPHNYWDTFPEKRQRESKMKSLPEPVQQGIKEIYGDFSERTEKVDDVFVIKPKWYRHRILYRMKEFLT